MRILLIVLGYVATVRARILDNFNFNQNYTLSNIQTYAIPVNGVPLPVALPDALENLPLEDLLNKLPASVLPLVQQGLGLLNNLGNVA